MDLQQLKVFDKCYAQIMSTFIADITWGQMNDFSQFPTTMTRIMFYGQ
jgi:hypothetical protein